MTTEPIILTTNYPLLDINEVKRLTRIWEGDGAESLEELNDFETNIDGGFGTSSLPIK